MGIKLSLALEEYVLECQVQNQSNSTLKARKESVASLIKYVGDIPINEVTRTLIKQYIIQYKQTCKATTVNSRIVHLRGLFNYFVTEGEIPSNPFEGVKLLKEEKQVIRTYSENTVFSIIEGLTGKDFLTVRNKTILILLVETGIRCSELCSIKLSDISENSIKIMGKGSKVRHIPITQALAIQLKKYLRVRLAYLKGKNTDYLFISRVRKHLERSGVYEVVKLVFDGVETSVPVTVHNFRRFFAQQMLENVDLYTVSRLLGHTDLKTTEKYIRGTEDKKILERGMKSPMSKLFA